MIYFNNDYSEGCHQTVAQTGTVQEQIQAKLPAGGGQCFQLCLAVERAILRGIGDVYQLGLSHMFKAAVCPVSQHSIPHLFCGDLSVIRGAGQNLVAGGLHGAGFMDIDMTANRAQSTLMGTQSSGNDSQIRLGTTHQKVNSHILAAAEALDLRGCLGAVFVLSIAA